MGRCEDPPSGIRHQEMGKKNHQQFRDDGGLKLLKSELQLPSSGNRTFTRWTLKHVTSDLTLTTVNKESYQKHQSR